jgi:hypothetical protein
MSSRINKPRRFNQPPLPRKKWNLKTGGPPGLINCLARTWLINHQCWNTILFYFPTLFIFKWFPYSILRLKPHEHQNPSLLIIDLKQKNYNSNDRFLIKFFIKIISFDGSQRVPSMSPCAPLIIIRRFPLLINPFQGGVSLEGKLGKTLPGPSDLMGGLINRCWHYLDSWHEDLPKHGNWKIPCQWRL